MTLYASNETPMTGDEITPDKAISDDGTVIFATLHGWTVSRIRRDGFLKFDDTNVAYSPALFRLVRRDGKEAATL